MDTKSWEVVVELQSPMQLTRVVEARDDIEARKKVWLELDDHIKDRVSDIEVFEIND